MGVIEDGIGGNSYRRSTYRHSPVNIVAMKPDEAHTGYAVDNKPLSYRMFYVTPETLRDLVPSSGVLCFGDFAIRDRECAHELLDFHSRWEADDDEFFLESAFASLFSKLIHRHATRAPILHADREPRAVRLIKEYLEARYTTGVRLPIW